MDTLHTHTGKVFVSQYIQLVATSETSFLYFFLFGSHDNAEVKKLRHMVSNSERVHTENTDGCSGTHLLLESSYHVDTVYIYINISVDKGVLYSKIG